MEICMVEELKTVKKYTIELAEDVEITLRARSKKQEREIELLLKDVENDLKYLINHKRFKVRWDGIYFIVYIDYDLVKIKRLYNYDLADEYVQNLYDYVTEHKQHLQELSEIARVCFFEYASGDCILKYPAKDEKELLEQLAKIAKYLREHEKEILEQFDTVLRIVSDYIKALNKAITEANREYLKFKKELKKLEEEALENGNFEKVSDERLKEYFRHLFPAGSKLIVLDKSSKHRAVLFAEVDYNEAIYPNEQYVKRLSLVGEDDNREEWRHIVIDYLADDRYPPRVSEVFEEKYTVEDAMAILFDVPTDAIKIAKRQGDILFIPVESSRVDAKTKEVVDELEVRANHTIKAEKIEILDQDYVFIPTGDGFATRVDIYGERLLIRLESEAIVEHPSHKPLKLESGLYIIIPLPIKHAD